MERSGSRGRDRSRAARLLVAVASLVAVLLAGPLLPSGPGALAGQTPTPDPVPVLLVPGWGDGAEDLVALEERFVAAGWPEVRVARLSFADPIGSNETHAAEVARAVAALRDATGAPEVDVVAHSMGGLALRRYLTDPAARAAVRRVVFLATPHRGTFWATFVWGDGAVEMVPGSDFLEALDAIPLDPTEVPTLAVRTPVDTHVMPASSALFPGGRNVEVCCPTHWGLKDDEETFEEIRAFLRPDDGR